MQYSDLLLNHCGLALLYYWDVLNESLFGRSLHIKQIKWWYLALGILLHLSQNYSVHIYVYQTVLKRYELISPYPFFVAVRVFLITCLVLLIFAFSLTSFTFKERLPCAPCVYGPVPSSAPPGHPHPAQAPPQISHCFCGHQLLDLFGLMWAPLESQIWLSGYVHPSAPTSAVSYT